MLSLSNHWVGQESPDSWIKVARDNSEWATNAIVYDGTMNLCFGRDVRFTMYDGRIGFIMPDLGTPYVDIPVDESIKVVKSIQQHSPPPWAHTSRGHVARGVERAHRRLSEPEAGDILRWSLVLYETLDEDALRGDVIVHTDLHSKNILRREASGEVSVIDWESAIRASPDVEWANLYHSYVVAGASDDDIQRISAQVRDPKVFATALRLKAVSAVSWLYENSRENGKSHDESHRLVAERIDRCNKYMYLPAV